MIACYCRHAGWVLFFYITDNSDFTELDADTNEWLNDEDWEKNWNQQVSGSSSKASAINSSKPATSHRSNANDFESYNPLSSVTAKPKTKTSDDDLWDLLNN